jgi:hypothetical protein
LGYLQQRSLPIGDASTRTFGSGDRAVLRGLDCAVDLYCSSDKSLVVLCAKPTASWVFGNWFKVLNEQLIMEYWSKTHNPSVWIRAFFDPWFVSPMNRIFFQPDGTPIFQLGAKRTSSFIVFLLT